MAEYIEQGGMLVPKLPSPGDCSSSLAEGVSIVPVLGLAAVGVAAYFLLG